MFRFDDGDEDDPYKDDGESEPTAAEMTETDVADPYGVSDDPTVRSLDDDELN